MTEDDLQGSLIHFESYFYSVIYRSQRGRHCHDYFEDWKTKRVKRQQ